MADPVIVGTATLWCEDNMATMARYPDKHFDLAIVDPPYFDGPNRSGYYGKGYSSLGVQREKYYADIKSWAVPEAEYFAELQRVSKHQIIWGANHFADRERLEWSVVHDASWNPTFNMLAWRDSDSLMIELTGAPTLREAIDKARHG